jgi:hypothetical protein
MSHRYHAWLMIRRGLSTVVDRSRGTSRLSTLPSAEGRPDPWAHWRVLFKRIRPGILPLTLCACLPPLIAIAQSQTTVQHLASSPRAGEVDTADQGLQAGGKSLGYNYQLTDLRCSAGEAIVGVNIRRGDALDFMQIACAKPVCTNGSCQWSSSHWGASAGNPYGGDSHPAMVCAQNEIVSGFRARVVTFFYRKFDYAEDIEIECAQMTSAPTSQGFFPVVGGAAQGSSAGWHHPEGGLSLDTLIPRWRTTFITPVISCRARGWGATAISLGVSDFVSSHVLQAVSLYCPAGRPQAPTIAKCVDMQNDPLHLQVDAQLRSVSQRSYNCFHYVRTFIEGKPPSSIFSMWWDVPNSSEIEGPFSPENYRYLEGRGYQRLATSTSLQTFQAQVGDIVTVQNPPNEQQGFPYLHGAIVVQVSANGQIVRLRQKANVQLCVMDMDPVTFMTKYYGLAPGYQYELWRNPNRQGLPQAQ